MPDYTTNQNTLFNNNATTNLTGNTSANTTGNTSGTNTSAYTQNTLLPGQYTAGLLGNFQQGTTGLQNVPNVQYTGQYVAPTNWVQNNALTNLASLGGYTPQQVTPGNVTQYAGGTGAGGLSTAGMNFSGYMNPFTRQVIQTSLDQLNRQLAQTNQATAGQAALSGAFGGDRATIAQTENARNANEIGSQMIAGLNSQNFTQAQAAAQADLARQLQGGTTQAQLGLAAGQGNQLAGLQGANLRLGTQNALMGFGNLQQNNQTQGNLLAYQDWLRTQQNPFQIAQAQLQAGLAGLPYLAQHTGTTTGTQTGASNTAQTGTTSSTQNQVGGGTQNTTASGTYPQSTASQVLGGVTTAAGLAGLLGGNNTGGLIGGIGSLYSNTLGSNGLNIFGAAPSISSGFNNFVGTGGVNSGVDYTQGLGNIDFSGGLGSSGDFGFVDPASFGYARGGLIGYGPGGDVEDNSYLSAYDDSYDPGYDPRRDDRYTANLGYLPTAPDMGGYESAMAPVDSQGALPEDVATAPENLPVPPVPPQGGPPQAGLARPMSPSVAAPAPAPMASTPVAGLAPTAASPIQLPAAAAQGGPASMGNPFVRDDFIGRIATGTGGNSWALPVLAAGLGMLSARGPHTLANIGQGGAAGLQTLMHLANNRTQAAQRYDQMQLNAAYRQGLLGVRQQQAGTQQQRADTYTQSSQQKAALQQSQADLARARAERLVATGAPRDQAYQGAADDLRQQGWSESDIYRELKGLNIRQQNADNASTRNTEAADRQSSLNSDRDRRAQQSANNTEDNAARSLIHAASVNGQQLGYADALAQVRSGRNAMGAAAIPGGASASDPIAAARDAIARGAPRDAVLARLRQFGIVSPAGF